jgi:ABC-2 type transport system permease protein
MDMAKQFTGFQTVMLYTVRKLLLSKRIYITLLILLFIVAVMAYASTLELTEEEIEDGEDLVDRGVNLLTVLILFFFMPVMAMIYGSSLVRDEMDDRSITAVVTSPMDRVITFTAYYLGLAISVSVIMLMLLTAGFMSYFGNVGMADADGIYGAYASLMVIGAFAYSALFIMISVMLSKPIFFGLFYAFIWEGFIGSIPGRISWLSIKHYLLSMGSHWISRMDLEQTESAHSVSDSAWILVILSVVVFVLGAWLFREKEFT